jgi:small subunit ribosomal protein S16
MLRIRLSRTGAKKQPSYRIVVADVESKRDGRIVERIGHYNPRLDPVDYRINEDRALYWLSVGAQPSDPVRRLLAHQGTMDRLVRLRQGEPKEDLVAEFLGAAPVESAEEAVVEPVEADVEDVDEATEVAEAVDELVADEFAVVEEEE